MSAGAESGLEPGAEFAGHRIDLELGRGGMGIVYRARNLALDRVRALKVLAPELSADARFRERFQRESRLAASIEHPNVIPVHDAGERDGRLYIAMRLVEGRDLRREVEEGGPLDPRRLAAITAAIAAALDAAHGAGLVHRDVKPANVLVGHEADEGRVYLTDFGISRRTASGETVTRAGELVGTADFVAPEQIAGDPVDHRADIYALGAVVHYAATGQSPFPRESELAVLFAHANSPRPRPSTVSPGLPPGLDAVVARAMAVDPDDRYQSAAELSAALRAAVDGGPTTPLPPPAPRPERRRRALLGAAAAAAIAAAVAAIAVIGGLEDDDPQGPASDARTETTTADAPPVEVLPPIDVGDGPSGLTVGDLRVWVAAGAADEVDGIDLVTKEVERIRLEGPASVAVGFGSIWAVSPAADALYRLDPAQGLDPLEIALGPGSEPVDVAVDDSHVWVAERGGASLARVDPAEPLAGPERVALGTSPRAIATGAGDVWVANGDDASVLRVDAAEARRTSSPIAVDELPTDIAYGEGAVWTISNLRGTVTEIDPERAEAVGEPARVGDLPRGVKAGLDYVWVALGGDDAVVRVEPATREPAGEPIPVGRNPSDIALGPDSVWVANDDDATITRIDP